jgi:hypothetical protein
MSEKIRGPIKDRKFLEEAEKYGGSDFKDWQEYLNNPNEGYANKLNHFLRSLHHQPNHKRKRRKIFGSDED